MDAVDLARWQFGITTVYHFLFVPLTIGLSATVAGFQTAWFATGREHFRRLTKYFGTLLVINFATGVVTGLVQEFQFGLNWSAFSRFVGDIVGVPLAIEGLLAFFLESTFLGLWIFGWDRLPRWLHLACIWIVAIGTQLSAYVILAANSWMQQPTGFRVDPETGRAYLDDFTALLTSETAVASYLHVASAAFVVGGGFVAGVAMWRLGHRSTPDSDRSAFRTAAAVGAVVTLVAAAGVVVTGDHQAKLVARDQPMKLAAAEGLFETESPAAFSLLTIGNAEGTAALWSVRASHLLSVLATGTWDGEVRGIHDLQEEYVQRFGPGDYVPNVPLSYWSFRFMIGLGLLAAFLALLCLALLRWGGPLVRSRWVGRVALVLPLLPLLANSWGWIFRETGRQPWLAFGLFKTAEGVSPGVTPAAIVASMAAFTVVYGVLAVVEVALLARNARELPPAAGDGPEDRRDSGVAADPEVTGDDVLDAPMSLSR